MLAVPLVVACGASSSRPAQSPRSPEADAAARRLAEVEKLKPADPYELRERAVFRAPDRCGQGPYRVEANALETKFGERLVIYACAPHDIAGNFRLTTIRKDGREDKDEREFGYDHPENAACKSTATTAVTSGAARVGGVTDAGGGDSASPHATASASAAAMHPLSLLAATAVPSDCRRVPILNYQFTSTSDGIGVDGHFTLDVWSDEPNDYEGAVFVIEQQAVVADMTLDRWKAYNAAYDAYLAAYRQAVAADVAAGNSEYVDTTVKTPPPPPPRAETPPPKPSVHARWIPGYWLYAGAKFHWIAGLWDVPDADVQQRLTVVAPRPPPARPAVVDDKPSEPPPTEAAVWTPGSWHWDGRGYVWIAGAWRIPPDSHSTWQAPSWAIHGSGAVYLPGGWHVRVHVP